MHKCILLSSIIEGMQFYISHQIARLMSERGLSQTALSRKTGVPFATINRILNEAVREPRHHSVVRLAHFFAVTPESIYGPCSMRTSKYPKTSLETVYDNIMSLSDDDRKALLAKFEVNLKQVRRT